MGCAAPRAPSSHWGSLKSLDQRVPVFPSTALAATQVEPGCTDDAVTGSPRDSRTTGGGGPGARAATERRGGAALPVAPAVLPAPGWLVAAIATTTAAETIDVAATIASAVTSEGRRLLGRPGPASPARSSATVAERADHPPGACAPSAATGIVSGRRG